MLENNNIPYEKIEHQAVFTVAEVDKLNLPHPEAATKNLFLKDKKGKYQKLKLGSSVKTSWVRITIKSVYAGSKYDDCCISEIEVK